MTFFFVYFLPLIPLFDHAIQACNRDNDNCVVLFPFIQLHHLRFPTCHAGLLLQVPFFPLKYRPSAHDP